jgi:hypothetical protein
MGILLKSRSFKAPMSESEVGRGRKEITTVNN